MRFEYLLLADAVNAGPDGKVNALGIGARVVTLDRLPTAAPAVILGSVAASVDEAGEYDVEVDLVDPAGAIETILHGRASVSAEVLDPRVPTGIGFAVGLVRPYTLEGVHTIRARVGDVAAEYALVVKVRDQTASTEAEVASAQGRGSQAPTA